MCRVVTVCSVVCRVVTVYSVVCTVVTVCKVVFAVVTVWSIVRYSTAGLRIVKVCVQFLLLVVLYGTVLKD